MLWVQIFKNYPKINKKFYNVLGGQGSNFVDINTLQGIRGGLWGINTRHGWLCHDPTTPSNIRHVSTPCRLAISCSNRYRDSIGFRTHVPTMICGRAPCNHYIVLNEHCDHTCTPNWTNINTYTHVQCHFFSTSLPTIAFGWNQHTMRTGGTWVRGSVGEEWYMLNFIRNLNSFRKIYCREMDAQIGSQLHGQSSASQNHLTPNILWTYNASVEVIKGVVRTMCVFCKHKHVECVVAFVSDICTCQIPTATHFLWQQ